MTTYGIGHKEAARAVAAGDAFTPLTDDDLDHIYHIDHIDRTGRAGHLRLDTVSAVTRYAGFLLPRVQIQTLATFAKSCRSHGSHVAARSPTGLDTIALAVILVAMHGPRRR